MITGLNTKRRYKSMLRDSAHQSKIPMRQFHWLKINGFTFSLNFEMESDFFVFQRIFVCFVIHLVPYSFSSFLEGSLVMAVASMLKRGNKSENI